MNERQSDFEWLQQFARAGNQSAFRELVRQHIDLVFATALRKVGDAGGAEEISQNVFSALARKAWQFAPDDSLPAWLHKTALLESQAWQRGEMRRRRREQTAAELGTTMKTSDEQPAFRALVPLLDEALLSLREKDREALLLRFYESQSLKNVGAALGVSDDTAQKRVTTALEKLSQFFQRRGFKTATVTATTAALQHTVASATSATVAVVFNAAIQTAPPALVGIGALLARFASLTKWQTAVVCAVVVIAPVAWQWSGQKQRQNEAARLQSELDGNETQFASIQNEIERLREIVARQETELAASTLSAGEAAVATAGSVDWRQRIRDRLFASDYRWPDDLSLVRIPKSVVPQLNVSQPVRPPGKIASETRELLGLSPTEREQAESLLEQHFTRMDELAAKNFYETNIGLRASIPATAQASNVWVLPKLGDAAAQQATDLKTGLEHTLSGGRWAWVESELGATGVGTLQGLLRLDAADTRTEIAGWLVETDGELHVSYQIVGGLSDRGTYWSSGSPSIPVRYLLTDDFESEPAARYGWVIHEGSIPPAVKESMLAWVRREAGARFEKGGGK